MGILNLLVFVGIAVVFAVVGTAMGRARTQKMDASNKLFLEKYPDAAKVYPYSRASITTEAVRIHTVDGGEPELFYESGKQNPIAAIIAGITGNSSSSGVYLKPGTSVVEMSYYHNRPGVFYKNVTTTTDTVKKDIQVEPNKQYSLSFDRKAGTFSLEEIA